MDNGVAYHVTMSSSSFPKRGDMSMSQIIESTLEISASGSPLSYSVQALNEAMNQVASVGITVGALGGTWGVNLWGDGTLWTSSQAPPKTFKLNWSAPIVINKLGLTVSALAAQNVAIGTFYARVQKTGYTLDQQGA